MESISASRIKSINKIIKILKLVDLRPEMLNTVTRNLIYLLRVISSDPLCKDDNARLTTAPVRLENLYLIDNVEESVILLTTEMRKFIL